MTETNSVGCDLYKAHDELGKRGKKRIKTFKQKETSVRTEEFCMNMSGAENDKVQERSPTSWKIIGGCLNGR